MCRFFEVALRDGLQNEKKDLALKDRFQLVKRLCQAGVQRIELGSFVSPKALPQMQCVGELTKKVLRAQSKGELPKNVSYAVFVPNQKGFEKAVECALKEVSFFVSCTEAFSQKNINMSLRESLKVLNLICQKARRLKIKVRVYLSAAFSCPYEGTQPVRKVSSLAERIMQEEVSEISLSDTIGTAVPTDVLKLMERFQEKAFLKKLALHFHDTRGMALANVAAGLNSGVRVFDASIGGLGGCPYAPGASGNVATEDLAYMLEKMNFKTGLKLSALAAATHFLEKKLSRSLPAKLSRLKFL